MKKGRKLTLTKREWLLLLLRERALDRIRLMKALFLIWQRSHRQIQDYYQFVPYMYGPCSFELYRELDTAERERLVIQVPHPVSRWAPYFLTPSGASMADAAKERIDATCMELLASVAREVESLPFFELLERVYSEAPDFATKSVARAAIQR